MRIIALALVASVAGCASPEQTVPVQPVRIVASDFCAIAGGKLTWHTSDTTDTIDGIRRFNAKYSKRCVKTKSQPTS